MTMKTEILCNGKVLEGSFYSLRLNAAVYFLRPQLQLYGPMSWLETLKKGDKIELKGDGQLLFTGQIEKIKEAERSQVFIGAAQPLERELQLNFSKEKWHNILAEVWPENDCKADDFECRHYSHKCSIGEHLVFLHNKLQKRSKKSYWMYLDEQNRLQIQQAGEARGKSPQQGVLIEHESSADTYQAFPLLVGMATNEGIAERMELAIRNQSGELRVWWTAPLAGAAPNAWGENQNAEPETSQHLVKGAIDLLKPEGTIQNQGSRSIYLVISDEDTNYRADDYIRELHSGSAYTGKVDGAVDITGKVVCKKEESNDLIFTGGNQFSFEPNFWQKGTSILKSLDIGIGDPLPYGLYYGKVKNGELQFLHEDTGEEGKAMKSWYEMALEKSKAGR